MSEKKEMILTVVVMLLTFALKPLREFFASTYESPPSWYLEILKCVKSHNGKFTKEYTGFFDEAQTIVHLADWIACQRWCYFDLVNLK